MAEDEDDDDDDEDEEEEDEEVFHGLPAAVAPKPDEAIEPVRPRLAQHERSVLSAVAAEAADELMREVRENKKWIEFSQTMKKEVQYKILHFVTSRLS